MQSLILDYKKNSTTNSIFPIKYWNLCIELRLKFNTDYHISLKRLMSTFEVHGQAYA